MITHRNSLDICPGGVPLFIRLSQYDSSFTLIFDLFSHKGSFTVESGTTARFRELKPDGNAISIDATISGTTVTLAPSQANAQQMTAVAGNCKCELSLFKGDKELNTANFTLLIEKAVIDKDTPYSDSVIRELIDVTDRADEIMEAAETVDEAIADLPNLIDPTLTLEDHAADAKAVGDAIAAFEGISDEVKEALLNCFAHVAWNDGSGQPYYDALHDALYTDDGLLYDWDFTEGLTDRKQGITLELRSGSSTLPTLESDGIHYTAAQQFIMPFTYDSLPITYFFGKTIQLDVKSYGAGYTNGHTNCISFRHGSNGWDSGLIYRNSYGWSFYNGSSWASSIYSGMTGRTDISGKKISLYLDQSGYAKVYIDGEYKGTSSNAILTTDMGGLMIGCNRAVSSGGSFYPAVITGLRIYDREVA